MPVPPEKDGREHRHIFTQICRERREEQVRGLMGSRYVRGFEQRRKQTKRGMEFKAQGKKNMNDCVG